MVKRILHGEGAIFFLVALYFYHQMMGNWILFVVILLLPDVSMVGYFKNKKLGAVGYNLVHNYILSVAIVSLGYFIFHNQLTTQIGIILFAHVAMDRFFGYGLKYPTSFKDTHLQKV